MKTFLGFFLLSSLTFAYNHDIRDYHHHYGNQQLLHIAVMKNPVSIIRPLIIQGMRDGVNLEIHTKNHKGQIPLHLAARYNTAPVVHLLLEYDSPVDAVDNRGWTPLHMAARYNHDDLVAEVLIKWRADINARDHKGRTPLYYALKYRNTKVAQVLKRAGAVE